MYSMTGYGEGSQIFEPYKILLEIKTLNSKYSDVRIKLPPELSSLEADIRRMILDTVQRGKVEIQLMLDGKDPESEQNQIDRDSFIRYYRQLIDLAESLNLDQKNIIPAIIQLPGVVVSREFVVEEGMRQAVMQAVEEALTRLDDFRKKEGDALSAVLKESVLHIMEGRSKVGEMEGDRIAGIKERLMNYLNQEVPAEKVDRDRFEQELIYYLDKLDVYEEMVRLEQHCIYFIEILDNEEVSKGKKLSFISQEIGREINTIGSKASHAGIQRVVVEMKNELDKIKEQLANVL